MTTSPDDQMLSPSPSPKRSFWRRVLLRLIIYLIPIGIIAVIAIPNLMRSRISSGESNYVRSIRTINTANVTYSSTYPERGFAPTLKALGGRVGAEASADAAQLIDDRLANGEKSGYGYTYQAFDHDGDRVFESYSVNADPMDPSAGQRHLYSDQSGVIRWEQGRPAGPNSAPLQ